MDRNHARIVQKKLRVNVCNLRFKSYSCISIMGVNYPSPVACARCPNVVAGLRVNYDLLRTPLLKF